MPNPRKRSGNRFSDTIKLKCLLWSGRHCCLCGKSCGTDIEIAHIDQDLKPDPNIIDNAIALCYDCHSEIGRYNKDHPRGNRYKSEELKTRRNQIYDQQTSHLVPRFHYKITQQQRPTGPIKYRKLPDIGFFIKHSAGSYPAKLLVTIKIKLGSKNFPTFKKGHYSGRQKWHMNPALHVSGHFKAPEQVVNSKKLLQVQVLITIIDIYDRHHKLLPISWRYKRKSKSWYFEP